MITDPQGNRFYTTKEAYQTLGVSRSTFLKLAKEAKLQKHQVKHDKNRYYRVEDVEGLRNRPVEVVPVEDGKSKAAA